MRRHRRHRHHHRVLERIDDPFRLYSIVRNFGVDESAGKVYEAVQNATGETVLVKVVENFGEFSTVVEKTLALLLTLDSLSVVNYRDIFVHTPKNDVWIVTDLMPGSNSLCRIVKALNRPLQEAELSSVVAGVLNGLVELERHGLSHGDLRASNIVVCATGRIKLNGLVFAQSNLQRVNHDDQRSSVLWMAPEVILETRRDSKSDIWSLGITLLELGESGPPFADVNPMRALFLIPKKPAPCFAQPGAWSSQMNDFLRQCLHKEPAKRMSASNLLSHPVVGNAPPSSSLKSLLSNPAGREEESGPRSLPVQGILRGKGGPSSTPVPVSNHPNISSSDEIRSFFLKHSLGQYLNGFLEEEIVLEDLPELITAEMRSDLNALIPKRFPRRRFVRAVRDDLVGVMAPKKVQTMTTDQGMKRPSAPDSEPGPPEYF